MKKERVKKELTAEQKMLAGYQRKLTAEAIVKSVVLGLIAGFLLSILVSIISFATKYNALWISLVVWARASAGLSVMFYFVVFRTTVEKTASRMDGMGLDERVITMLELAGTDSVIAQKQRQDTQGVLQNVTPKKMKFGGLKLFVIFASILGALAVTAVLIMSFSTVKAVQAAENPPVDGIEQISEEDRIIQEMIDDLRRVVAEAKIKEDLRDKLNGMIDDLENSLKPTDSLQVKIAKISDTSQKIHKLLQDAMAETTIPEELQKHDTTKELGKALESGDIKIVETAFKNMYDSIHVLVGAEKWLELQQTAYDILDSIEDATNKDEELIDPLEKLAQAFLDAIKQFPPPPEGEGDEETGGDELDQAVQDAIQDAMDAIQGVLPDMPNKDDLQDTDNNLGDIFQDAMDQLDPKDPSEEEEDKDDNEGDKEDEGESSAPSHPSEGGDIIYDSVIDGKTPYNEVYEEFYKKAMELLTSGDLTDEQREIIENYLDLLS